jgi:hypothetical protein
MTITVPTNLAWDAVPGGWPLKSTTDLPMLKTSSVYRLSRVDADDVIW